MFHLTGIQYLKTNTNINIPLADYGTMDDAMMRYHQEMAAMYASETLKGCGILVYDDDLNPVIDKVEFKTAVEEPEEE